MDGEAAVAAGEVDDASAGADGDSIGWFTQGRAVEQAASRTVAPTGNTRRAALQIRRLSSAANAASILYRTMTSACREPTIDGTQLRLTGLTSRHNQADAAEQIVQARLYEVELCREGALLGVQHVELRTRTYVAAQ